MLLYKFDPFGGPNVGILPKKVHRLVQHHGGGIAGIGTLVQEWQFLLQTQRVSHFQLQRVVRKLVRLKAAGATVGALKVKTKGVRHQVVLQGGPRSVVASGGVKVGDVRRKGNVGSVVQGKEDVASGVLLLLL